MKIEFCVVGKTKDKYLEEGMNIYLKRLKHYIPFQMNIIPDIKNAGKLKASQVKTQEGNLILKNLRNEDFLILLDEKGKSFSSVQFAQFLEKKMAHSSHKIIFQIGGAFGFSEAVYQRANMKLSLSEMTFSHQMVRLFFLEQLYRAMTILRNEPYHNT